MKQQQAWVKHSIRSCMVLFWVVLILIIYQLPKYADMFSSGRTLYILSWPLLIDAQYLTEFEQKTGVRIKVAYFETAEELLSKIKATKGYGYDLIFPSDHTIEPLIKEGLLHELDKNKLTFWQDLDARLLDNYYDPGNHYSIPFFWAPYGLGVNKKVYGENPPKTLGLLFDKQFNPQHIVMTSSAREAILSAALYLFGSIEALKAPEAQELVKKTLLEQKAWVDVYTEERIDELLASENNNLAFGLSTDITRGLRNNPNIVFLLPEQGSFKVIDSVAIPKHSANIDLAYTFLNYLFQPEVMDHHIDMYNMCSPITTTKSIPTHCPTDEEFKRLYFLKDVIPSEQITDIWIDLLAS